MIFARGRSRVHSAHIGRDGVIHYRWHALFGQRVRLEGIEQRAAGSIASVEVQPGLMIKISAWMLDPASCAGMEIGAPRASLAALAALHDLLVGQELRRSSSDDRNVSGETRDEVFACTSGAAKRAPTAQHAARRADAARLEPDGTGRGRGRTGRVASGSGGCRGEGG